MIKARNRKLSMILVVAMMMTMFVGLGTASAASTYSTISIPTIGTAAGSYDLGIIEVSLSQAMAVEARDVLTVSLSDVTLKNSNILVTSDATVVRDATYAVVIYVPVNISGSTTTPNGLQVSMMDTSTIGGTRTSIDIRFDEPGNPGQGSFFVYMNQAYVSGASDSLIAWLQGSGTAFTAGSITIANVVSGGGTAATVKSIKNVGTNGGVIDTITIVESKINTWENGDKIKLKLPSGYGWVDGPIVIGGNWSFTGYNSLTTGETAGKGNAFTYTISENDRLLTITINNVLATRTTAARIDLAAGSAGADLVEISVTDDSVARKGDVTVAISGNNVTDQDLVVAKMGDYDGVVEEVVIQDAIAGWDTDLDKAQFKIIESLAGSLIKGRTISLTLPDGAKWNTNYTAVSSGITFDRNYYWPDLGQGADNVMTLELLKGTDDYFTSTSKSTPTVSNNGRTLKYVIADSSTSARSILFKKPQISIRADFTGPLNIEVGGNAGVEGSVQIAEVYPSLTVSADSNAKIVIGAQNQQISDIYLKEGASEAIDTSMGDRVELRLPIGTRWATKPTVEVTEGDVTIDSVSVNDETRSLVITFKSASTIASTIKLSGVAITADRTVPEGDMKLYISNASDALTDNSSEDFFNIDSISSTIIGQCVTPADSSSTAPTQKGGEFKIGSSTFYANGVAQTCSTPAVIDNDRALVAQRDLAAVLGAEIVWNEDDQTVTISKDKIEVVFTIGSTTYTVNGVSQTLPVAPKIMSGYTMLPARYAAEAFGAVVNWDGNTSTVFISL